MRPSHEATSEFCVVSSQRFAASNGSPRSTVSQSVLRACRRPQRCGFVLLGLPRQATPWCVSLVGAERPVSSLVRQTQQHRWHTAHLAFTAHCDAQPLARGEAHHQNARPTQWAGAFSTARAWRFAVGPASARTLGIEKLACSTASTRLGQVASPLWPRSISLGWPARALGLPRARDFLPRQLPAALSSLRCRGPLQQRTAASTPLSP